jgi:hypothetical protein
LDWIGGGSFGVSACLVVILQIVPLPSLLMNSEPS